MLFENLTEASLTLGLTGSDKKEVLARLVEALLQRKAVSFDKDTALRALMEREAMTSTGIGGGLAVPHVRLEGLEKAAVQVGIAGPEGIDFQALDNAPVYLVILVLSPKANPQEHLQVLSEISQKLAGKLDEVVENLRKATSPKQVLAILKST